MNLDDLRNSLKSLTSEFRGRRLLSVMGLIVAVAVAIPLLLSHSGKASALAPLPPAPAVTVPIPTPTASAPKTARRAVSLSRRRLSLPAHNPFVTVQKTSAASTAKAVTNSTGASATTATISPAKTQEPTTPTTTSPSTPSHSQTRSTSTSVPVAHTVTVSAPPVTHTVTETTTTKPSPTPANTRYADYQVQASVRQAGATGRATTFHNLARYQFVPSDNSAFASFLGVRPDLKTGVFVIGKGETVTGQGRCAPSAVTCTFLLLQPGQTASVTVPTGERFTLTDLRVRKVMSSASIVSVDQTGKSVVTAAKGYVDGLKSLTYGLYTGLLHIDIGTPVPVKH